MKPQSSIKNHFLSQPSRPGRSNNTATTGPVFFKVFIVCTIVFPVLVENLTIPINNPLQLTIFILLAIATLMSSSLKSNRGRVRILTGLACLSLLGILPLTWGTFPGSAWMSLTGLSVFASLFSGRRTSAATFGFSILSILILGHIHFRMPLIVPSFEPLSIADWGIRLTAFVVLNVWLLLILPKIATRTLLPDVSAEKLSRIQDELARAKKIEAQGILSGGVAHDLNNILSGIATYPEVLLMDQDLSDPVRKGLGLIKDSGRKAADIVSDLLTITRGTTAEVSIININTVVENYLSSAEHNRLMAAFPNVEIIVKPALDLINIRSSYIHVEKSLMNLVTNAVEEVAAKPHGVVTIQTENRVVDSTVNGYETIPPGKYSLLSVSDNGSGIDREAMERIFEPYYSKKIMGRSGTGLGLTIVRNTVQIHGGHVDVTSDTYGTCISLFFPSVLETLSEVRETTSMDAIQGKGQSILVVDDFVTQIDIACSILSRLGYQPLRAESGEKAIEIVRSTHIDLVILDMIMYPGMDGLDTYREMLTICPGLKAVIASGHEKSEDVTRAQALGAGQFVKKPYTIFEMGTAIKEELEK